MLRHHPGGRTGVPPSTARTGKSPTPWPSAATGWPQPLAALEHPQARRSALPDRSQRALHQQPCRTGWAHDETASEDLRRISLRGWCEGFCHHPLGALHGQKAGLEYAADLDQCPIAPDRRPPAGLIGLFATWAVTLKDHPVAGYRKVLQHLAGREIRASRSSFQNYLR